MLPVVFDLSCVDVVLIGTGSAAVRKLAALDAAMARVTIYDTGASEDLRRRAGDRYRSGVPNELAPGSILFVAGVADSLAEDIAARARARGVLVNVEDRKPWCDFHVPAVVRRGDLLITVSTSGKSPALAARVRRAIERLIGPEWAGRLETVATLRRRLRARGMAMRAVSRRTDAFLDARNWLP